MNTPILGCTRCAELAARVAELEAEAVELAAELIVLASEVEDSIRLNQQAIGAEKQTTGDRYLQEAKLRDDYYGGYNS